MNKTEVKITPDSDKYIKGLKQAAAREFIRTLITASVAAPFVAAEILNLLSGDVLGVMVMGAISAALLTKASRHNMGYWTYKGSISYYEEWVSPGTFRRSPRT